MICNEPMNIPEVKEFIDAASKITARCWFFSKIQVSKDIEIKDGVVSFLGRIVIEVKPKWVKGLHRENLAGSLKLWFEEDGYQLSLEEQPTDSEWIWKAKIEVRKRG